MTLPCSWMDNRGNREGQDPPLLVVNAKTFRFCHCEEGISGAPDVAISWNHLSKCTAVSKYCTGRLYLKVFPSAPRRCAPRNDSMIESFSVTRHYGNIFYRFNTYSGIAAFSMTPVCFSSLPWRPDRFLGTGTPVMADSRSICSNSVPEVSPPMADSTATGNL